MSAIVKTNRRIETQLGEVVEGASNVSAYENMLGLHDLKLSDNPFVRRRLLLAGNLPALEELPGAQRRAGQMQDVIRREKARQNLYAELAGASRTDHEGCPYKREALVGFILQLQLTPLFKGVGQGQGQDIEASIKERFLTTVTVAANLILDRCTSAEGAQKKMKSFEQDIAWNSEAITKAYRQKNERGPECIANSYCRVQYENTSTIYQNNAVGEAETLADRITAAQNAAAASSEAYAGVNTEHDATTVYSELERDNVKTAAAAAKTAAQAAAKIAFHAPGRAAAAALAEARANEAVVAAQAAQRAARLPYQEAAQAALAVRAAADSQAQVAQAAQAALVGNTIQANIDRLSREASSEAAQAAQAAQAADQADVQAAQAALDALDAQPAKKKARDAAKEAKYAAEIAAAGGVEAVLLAKAVAETAGVTDEARLIKKINEVLTSGMEGVEQTHIEKAKTLIASPAGADAGVDRICKLSATNPEIVSKFADIAKAAQDVQAAVDSANAVEAAESTKMLHIRAILMAGARPFTNGFSGFVEGCAGAQLLAVDPEAAPLRYENFGELDRTSKRPPMAIATLPDSAYKDAMHGLGKLLIEEGDVEKAANHVEKFRKDELARLNSARTVGLRLEGWTSAYEEFSLVKTLGRENTGESENIQLKRILENVNLRIDRSVIARPEAGSPITMRDEGELLQVIMNRATQIVAALQASDPTNFNSSYPDKNTYIREVAKHILYAEVGRKEESVETVLERQKKLDGPIARGFFSSGREALDDRLAVVGQLYPDLRGFESVNGLQAANAATLTSLQANLGEAITAERSNSEGAVTDIRARSAIRDSAQLSGSVANDRSEATRTLDLMRGNTDRIWGPAIKRLTPSRHPEHMAARAAMAANFTRESKQQRPLKPAETSNGSQQEQPQYIDTINTQTAADVKALLDHTTLRVKGEAGVLRSIVTGLTKGDKKGSYAAKPWLTQWRSSRHSIATAADNLKKAMDLVTEPEDQESPLTPVQTQERADAIGKALSCARKLQTECNAYMRTRLSLFVADPTGKHTAFSKSLQTKGLFARAIYFMRDKIYGWAEIWRDHAVDGRRERVQLVSNLNEQVALQCVELEVQLKAAQDEATAAMQAEAEATTEQQAATQAAAGEAEAAAAAAALTAASVAASAAKAAADAAITAASGAAAVQANQLEAESALEATAAAEKEAARKATEALAEKFHGIGFAPAQGGAAKSIVPELTSADDVKKQAAYGALLGWHTNGFTARDPASARANASTSTALCMSTAINMCGDAALDENGNATEEYVSACVAVALIMYVKSKGLSVELDNYGHQEAARSMVQRNAVVEVSKMKTQTLKERWELACATHARTTSPAAASLSDPRAAAEPTNRWWKRGAKPAPNETGADCAARVAEMRRMNAAYVTPCDEKLYKKVGVQGTALNRYRPCIGTFRIMSVLKQVSGSLTEARLAAHIGNVRVAMDVLDANINPRWSVPERYDLYKVLAKHFVSFGGDEITENDVPWVIALAEDYRGCTDAWPTQIHRQTQHPGMEYSVPGGGTAASGAVASEYNATAAINNCRSVFTNLPAVGQPYWADMNSELRKTASPPYYLQHVDPAATVISQLDAEGQKQVVTGVSKVMGYFVEPTSGGSTSLAHGSFSKGLGPTNGTHGSKWDTLVNLVNDATVDDFDGKWSSVDRQDILSYLGARSHPRDNRPEVGLCPPSVEGEVRYVIQSSLADLQVARDVVSQGASQIKGATACPDSDSVPYYSVPQDIYTRMQPTLLDAVKGEFQKLAARSDGAVVQAAELEEAVMKAISHTLANELSRLEYNIGVAERAANDLIIEGGAHVDDAQRKTLFHSTLTRLQAEEPAAAGASEGPEAGAAEALPETWGRWIMSRPGALLGVGAAAVAAVVVSRDQ